MNKSHAGMREAAMVISSRTPEGTPNHCPVCGNDLRLEPSLPTLDAPCPHCGHLLWFRSDRASVMEQKAADVLLEVATMRFGMLPQAIRAALEAIRDPERLKAALERVASCRSLEELADKL